jgi:2-iminobutanoate/2-iminopropanoate deaminase
MKKIITNEAPIPAGHYSQAISYNGLVFVAGQLPLDREGKMIKGDVEDQVRQTLLNVESILKASNSSMDRILKATLYIPDSSFWPEINRVYGEVMGDHKPARAVIPCGELHYGAAIEMEVIAACEDDLT